MEMWSSLDKATQSAKEKEEEQIVFSKLMEYCSHGSHIISYQCHMSDKKRGFDDSHFENHSNSISNSVAESDESERESGFEECLAGGMGGHETEEQKVIRFVNKFSEKICSEAKLSSQRSLLIQSMIRDSVQMHMKELELVNDKSSKLPSIMKPTIVVPPLLPKEDLLTPNGLRCYLISDGRGGQQSQFLPAVGALFLTNYRVIFRGWPKNLYGSETAITRFFPVSSLTKQKTTKQNSYSMEIEQQVWLLTQFHHVCFSKKVIGLIIHICIFFELALLPLETLNLNSCVASGTTEK